MTTEQVSLRFAGDGGRVWVEELTGFDEQSVRDVSTATAIALLDRLVTSRRDRSWTAIALTASDRDRLLAAVYRSTFGPRVEGSPRCVRCDSPFDLSFALDDLLAAVDRAPASSVVETLPEGNFLAIDGARFRLPTGEDELAVADLAPEDAERALFERCLVAGAETVDARAAIESALEEVAPVLDLEIATACPECGCGQSLHFDVQTYLLRAIEQERVQVAREVHRIAGAYGWSLREILGMRRSERRHFVELIESEGSPPRRSR